MASAESATFSIPAEKIWKSEWRHTYWKSKQDIFIGNPNNIFIIDIQTRHSNKTYVLHIQTRHSYWTFKQDIHTVQANKTCIIDIHNRQTYWTSSQEIPAGHPNQSRPLQVSLWENCHQDSYYCGFGVLKDFSISNGNHYNTQMCDPHQSLSLSLDVS